MTIAFILRKNKASYHPPIILSLILYSSSIRETFHYQSHVHDLQVKELCTLHKPEIVKPQFSAKKTSTQSGNGLIEGGYEHQGSVRAAKGGCQNIKKGCAAIQSLTLTLIIFFTA